VPKKGKTGGETVTKGKKRVAFCLMPRKKRESKFGGKKDIGGKGDFELPHPVQ